jgi:hypothetical protein
MSYSYDQSFKGFHLTIIILPLFYSFFNHKFILYHSVVAEKNCSLALDFSVDIACDFGVDLDVACGASAETASDDVLCFELVDESSLMEVELVVVAFEMEDMDT